MGGLTDSIRGKNQVHVISAEGGAPKARNVKAQGNALGEVIQQSRALKARNQISGWNNYAPSALVTFDVLDLGRWPRLLHFAPWALYKQNLLHHGDFSCKKRRDRIRTRD